MPHQAVDKELFKTEILNLPLFGFGIKGFMLSMIEPVLRVSKNTTDIKLVEKTLLIGKEMLDKPVSLMEGVEDVLVRIGK